ncbi:dihydrofolate reductase family protein [Paenibacillus sp. HWE-109]|uniref:dihydrofolate reductase family protein n=1 Tax=Paenibacillus sp. HWE-109 TaxID=1306526 RepID=UPI001EDDA001|nr:dihydrofolate reductase family protein [Paenibacillus sp. HWE-109]UKS27805.1 dihydrofolate reductase family protein [Paenibacillus sp. HWE-109]
MRKVIVFNRLSLDGFFTGLNGEIDWFLHDPEVDKAAHEYMHADTLLFGKLTYQMFVSYWPNVATNPNAPEQARALAEELNQMTKVVFSNSLEEATWVNSRLIKDNLVEEVRALKQGDGADITVFGSGTIVQQLVDAGLIDELLIVVTPVVLGTGRGLFDNVGKMNLKLLASRGFGSGNVLLYYGIR